MTGSKLLTFVRGMTELVSDPPPAQAQVMDRAEALLKSLVAVDDWLPAGFAEPHPVYYQQHLLYGDPLDRFSVISFVWGPGQLTPIHDHTVWGIIGMLRGAEYGEPYLTPVPGSPMRASGREELLEPGMTARVVPVSADIHKVRNAFDDRVSISIHVYGGNIGRIRRTVFDPRTSERKAFVSGYSGVSAANLWATE